jgi:hypothetical protein
MRVRGDTIHAGMRHEIWQISRSAWQARGKGDGDA